MSKIKASGTSSELAVDAKKELLLARQQAEIKASEVLFREASQKITDQREKMQSDNAEEQNQCQSKDMAQLSDVHLRPRTDGVRAMEEILTWILEMAGEDWEAFLAWQPQYDDSLSDQLQELSKLYLELLEAALKYAEGDNLALQLRRLDDLLAEKLSSVMNQNLEFLMHLLEKNGETDAVDAVRLSLYRQTAGKSLSPQAAHRLFVQAALGRYGDVRHSDSVVASSIKGGDIHTKPFAYARQSDRGMPSVSPSPLSGEGMIYQSSRKQNIRFRQVYDRQQNFWKEQIRQRKEVIYHARKGIVENTFHRTSGLFCSAKELERANQFAAHVSGQGNLFQNLNISARNEEVAGLLAAIMTIKGQVFAGESGQANSLVLSLQKAIGKMADHYLSQRGGTDVYYYILSVYMKMKNPQKVVQIGQDYAYRQFCEKQRDPIYQKFAAYSQESGFFRALQNVSSEKDLAFGCNVLQRDWELFLNSSGTIENSSCLLGAERYSPWGILADPGAGRTGGHENRIKIALAAFFLLGVLAVLIFRMGIG
ncbi:hypothetical protein AALB64_13645 [Lachnospiraceae bacterium 45-P1]